MSSFLHAHVRSVTAVAAIIGSAIGLLGYMARRRQQAALGAVVPMNPEPVNG